MNKKFLIFGDTLALLVLTVIGFASHGETDASYLPRAAAMFGPYLAGWFALAPAMGLFDADHVRSARQLWRPALTGFFAGQLASVLRGLILQSDVSPVFALVIGVSAAVGMITWRWIALRLVRSPR